MFWFSKKRDEHAHKRIDEVHGILKTSFSNLKKDMSHVSTWISHSKKKEEDYDKKFEYLNNRLEEIEQLFKQLQTDARLKQSSVCVQTSVQTGVATAGVVKEVQMSGNLKDMVRHLTVMERAIVWMMLNTDLKLSYEDMCAALGKDKSTLRGQMNNIKQKAEGLISEFIENNGKKRYFINDEIKESLLKEFKERVNVSD